ncbi:hypothetical protein AB4328_11735 [Vibrio breoganii]
MLDIYRVKTVYHILQVFILIFSEKNKIKSKKILFLDDPGLFKYKLAIEKTSLFDEVNLVRCTFNNKSLDLLLHFLFHAYFRFTLRLKSAFLKGGTKGRNISFYTPVHNIPLRMRWYLLEAKLFILEEGNYSYRKLLDACPNPFYDDSSLKATIKKVVGETFFIRYSNPNIESILFWSKNKYEESSIGYLNNAVINDLSREIFFLDSDKIAHLVDVFGFPEVCNSTSTIILTQPIIPSGRMSSQKYISLLCKSIESLDDSGTIYIKLHPRDSISYYSTLLEKYNIKLVKTDLPFELFGFFGAIYKYGITYDSTAIDVDFIENKIRLTDD